MDTDQEARSVDRDDKWLVAGKLQEQLFIADDADCADTTRSGQRIIEWFYLSHFRIETPGVVRQQFRDYEPRSTFLRLEDSYNPPHREYATPVSHPSARRIALGRGRLPWRTDTRSDVEPDDTRRSADIRHGAWRGP
jgi:hypothetical protein